MNTKASAARALKAQYPNLSSYAIAREIGADPRDVRRALRVYRLPRPRRRGRQPMQRNASNEGERP